MKTFNSQSTHVVSRLLLLLALGATAARAETTQVGPNSFHIVERHSTGEQAKQACYNFAVSISSQYNPVVYCHSAGFSTGIYFWEAGWLFTTGPNGPHTPATQSYLGNFYFCPEGEPYFEEVKRCVRVTEVPPPDDSDKGNGQQCASDKRKQQPYCGNPINPGNGNKTQREVDYAPAVNDGLSLVRTYNGTTFSADANTARPFGTRWTHRYDTAIRREAYRELNQPRLQCWHRADKNIIWCERFVLAAGDTEWRSVSILRGDGRRYFFNKSGDAWVGETDVNDKLTALYDSDGITIKGWTYASGETEETERYDANGRLLSIRSRVGTTQYLTYSSGTDNDTRISRVPADAPSCSHVQQGLALPAGRLLCVTDSWGRQLQFEYDEKGRIVKALDPAGQVYLFAYDGASAGCIGGSNANPACTANNLTRVTYPDGKNKTYYYNEAQHINKGAVCTGITPVGNGFAGALNQLTGLQDENGARFATWTYDCQGRALSSEHAGGTEKVSIYHGAPSSDGTRFNSITQYLGTPGEAKTVSLNVVFNRKLGLTRNASIALPCMGCGPSASRTYDANGNVESSTDWRGSKTNYTYDLTRNLEIKRVEAVGTPAAATITTQWHPAYRLPAAMAEPKRITTYTYDSSGNLLTRQEQATTDATGSLGLSAPVVGTARVWRWTYNDAGQVVSTTNPRNAVTTHRYDAQGNLASVTNPAGHVTTFSNHDAHGRPGRIVDANGLVTELRYSPRGWLVSKNVGGELTRFTYDGVGQITGVTLPDNSTLTYTYDEAHRLIAVSDSLGNSITYTLDLSGNRLSEHVKDPNGTLVRHTGRVYDTFNRLERAWGAQ
jgi:YD repeat-containing protein